MDEISSGPEPRRRSTTAQRIGLLAAGLGVGITLGAAGIAGAATDPPKPTAGSTAKPAPPGDHRGMRHGMRGLGPAGAIRGELVVPDGKGGFKTVKVQRGEVTAVSPTSLTVKSPDGVSQTYVLDATTKVNGGRATVASIRVGHKVGVLADVAGSTLTAVRVHDATTMPRRKPGRAPAAPSGYGDAAVVQPA
jgi:hypothetical protein